MKLPSRLPPRRTSVLKVQNSIAANTCNRTCGIETITNDYRASEKKKKRRKRKESKRRHATLPPLINISTHNFPFKTLSRSFSSPLASNNRLYGTRRREEELGKITRRYRRLETIRFDEKKNYLGGEKFEISPLPDNRRNIDRASTSLSASFDKDSRDP